MGASVSPSPHCAPLHVVNMICLIVLALAVFTAPASADTCTARGNRTVWDTAPPGFEWEDAFFGSVPKGAVVGGVGANGMEIYICRTFHNHNLIPGKVNSYMGNCDVAWGGTEHDVPMYQVLVNKAHIAEVSWVNASYGYHPPNAVVGGYKCDFDQPGGDFQYIGRSNFPVGPNGRCLASSVVYPGKVDKCLESFHWSYGGKAYNSSHYDILVWNYPVTTPRKPNTTEPITTSTEVPTSTTEFVPTSSTTEVSSISSTEFPSSSISSTEFPSSSTEFPPSSTEFPPSSPKPTECLAAGDVPAKYIAAPAGLKWVSGYTGGAVPPNAVKCGKDTGGQQIYVCRAYFHNSVITGKVSPDYIKACLVPWGGKENKVAKYDVLAKVGDVSIEWEKRTNGTHANHPTVVAAGWNCLCNKPHGTINYVGKTEGRLSPGGALLSSSVHYPGNINICHHNFHYSYSGKEYKDEDYRSMWVKKN